MRLVKDFAKETGNCQYNMLNHYKGRTGWLCEQQIVIDSTSY